MNKIIKNHRYIYRPLCTKVLTVAVINLKFNDFAVYIDVVNGINHDNEFLDVAKHGCKLDVKIAEILYPSLFKKYRWRN